MIWIVLVKRRVWSYSEVVARVHNSPGVDIQAEELRCGATTGRHHLSEVDLLTTVTGLGLHPVPDIREDRRGAGKSQAEFGRSWF